MIKLSTFDLMEIGVAICLRTADTPRYVDIIKSQVKLKANLKVPIWRQFRQARLKLFLIFT